MKYLFPERFTYILQHTNMSYATVAKKLGLKSKGTISKYATGKIKKIEFSVIFNIADLFDVSPIWLIGLTDDMHYKIEK